MMTNKTTYAEAEEEFETTGFISPQRFTKDKLDEIFDAAPLGTPFEEAVMEALKYYERQ